MTTPDTDRDVSIERDNLRSQVIMLRCDFGAKVEEYNQAVRRIEALEAWIVRANMGEAIPDEVGIETYWRVKIVNMARVVCEMHAKGNAAGTVAAIGHLAERLHALDERVQWNTENFEVQK